MRPLPRLAKRFNEKALTSLALIREIESARAIAGSPISTTNVEAAYEMAYLRIFVAWEEFLEQVFYRLLCGYAFGGNQTQLQPGQAYCPTIGDAENLLLAGRDYILWHSPSSVANRARRFFVGSHFELVIRSFANLEYFAKVRHRVAHSQAHALKEFDTATTALAGKRYKGSRPGRFLRDWDSVQTVPSRWLSSVSNELIGVAYQLSP